MGINLFIGAKSFNNTQNNSEQPLKNRLMDRVNFLKRFKEANKPLTAIDKDIFMNQALKLSEEGAGTKGGYPIGAIVVSKDGKIIGKGYSKVSLTHDPTAHAEIVAIRDAANNVKSPDLKGASLFTTVAPCPMCLAASYWANIGNIYYSISNEESFKYGFPDKIMFNDFARKPVDRTMPAEELKTNKDHSVNLLNNWFAQKKNQDAFAHLRNQASIKKLYEKENDSVGQNLNLVSKIGVFSHNKTAIQQSCATC